MERSRFQPYPTRTCDTCGKTLPEAARFCSNCGASLEGDTYPETREERRGLSPWVWAIIIVGVLLMGAVILGLPLMMITGLRGRGTVRNEISTIGCLRVISSVQAQFREGDMDNDNVLDYATSLAELSQAGLIDNVLGAGVKSGYSFGLSGSTFDWLATATPVASSMGKRNFIICTDGVIRFSSMGSATCSSPAIQ